MPRNVLNSTNIKSKEWAISFSSKRENPTSYALATAAWYLYLIPLNHLYKYVQRRPKVRPAIQGFFCFLEHNHRIPPMVHSGIKEMLFQEFANLTWGKDLTRG